MTTALPENARLGRYRLVKVLGAGAMGVVYEARDEQVGDRPVALKVVARELWKDQEAVKRFIREGRAAASIVHPSVATVHDVGDAGGAPFLVFELLEGGSLSERIKRSGRLPWREVAAIGAQLARALVAIHSAGIIHRDLKPANVLFDGEGRPKITDFGLVRKTTSSGFSTTAGITVAGEYVGTIAYMAPEQATAPDAINAQVDLYALGATLYSALTGRPPFVGSAADVVRLHVSQKPAPVRSLAPDVPERLDALVLKLLAKEPLARGSATALASELEAIAKGKVAKRKLPLWPAVVAFGASAAAIAAIAAYASSTRHAEPSPEPAPPPSKPEPARAAPAGHGPPWYRELAEKERPPHPLPPGIEFGDKPFEYVNAKDGSLLVWVAGGFFKMGSSEGRNDERPRDVNLIGFFIGKYEVTSAQFGAFVKATGHKTRADLTGGSYVIGGRGDAVVRPGVSWRFPEKADVPAKHDHPVVHVDWADAHAYCAWAGLRLPKDEEWEKAARWDPKTKRSRRYSWGDDEPGTSSRKVGNLADESLLRVFPDAGPWVDFGKLVRNRPDVPAAFKGYDDGWVTTSPVGSFPDNASPCGALDMSGNVLEWCQDEAVDQDEGMAAKGTGFLHLLRGGSWATSPVAMRASFRTTGWGTCDSVGFRVAR